MSSNQHNNNPDRTRAFHGAALIDAQGREIPITEAMIARACEQFERHWQYPPQPRQAR